MMKCTILLLLIGLSTHSYGQRNLSWIGAETDPMTTIFGARTLSIVIEPKTVEHWSLFFNVISADFPGWMDDFLNPNNKERDFDSKITFGSGFAMDYFLKSPREGYYIGLINLFFNNRVVRGNETRQIPSHNIIPRVGYRWYPFKKPNFYLNPFLGIRYEYLLKEEVLVDGEEFRAAGFGPFGTLHIGYHF